MTKDNIGAITSIDEIDSSDITKEHREEWVLQLKNSINQIEGVSKTFIEDATKSYNEIVLAVEVKSEAGYNGYKLHINTHSFAAKLRNVLESDKYVQANIIDPEVESPTKLNSNTDEYNRNYYLVEIFYP